MKSICIILFAFLLIDESQSYLPTECGIQVIHPHPPSSGPHKRIVGGVEVVPHSWPWVVALKYHDIFRCAGNLVKTNTGSFVVVTAAHCLDTFTHDLSAWKVRMGMYSRDFGSNEQGFFSEHKISSVMIHPDYSPINYNNDIAIIRLQGNVTLNNGTLPICVANKMYTVGETCVVVGWGTTEVGGSTQDRLREAYKPITDPHKCDQLHSDLGGIDTNTMLCAGYDDGGIDACEADSGGPLACQRNGKWYLTGIISWGYGCAHPNRPGVYTNVFHYEQSGWLASTAGI